MGRDPQCKNVLIVEDDHDIRDNVAEILTMEGYTVTVAGHGLEGLHLLGQIPLPCIILLDLMMPVMDGREFLARLKEHPVFRDCAVLIMTASNAEPPSGTVGLLRKPFKLPDLLAVVRRYCP